MPSGRSLTFRLQGSHLLRRRFPPASTRSQLCHSPEDQQILQDGPTTPLAQRLPPITCARFRLFPVRSPLLGEYLFLWVIRCFSSPRALASDYVFIRACPRINAGGLPHSGIPGSSLASSSPRLIAGSYALHRPLMPRHPPQALSSLPTPSVFGFQAPPSALPIVPTRDHAAGGANRSCHIGLLKVLCRPNWAHGMIKRKWSESGRPKRRA